MTRYQKKSKRKSTRRRRSKPRLAFCLIPATTAGINCRTQIPELWEIIRHRVYKEAGYKCQICGSIEKLHAHEVFRLRYNSLVQELIGFKCLCYLCHITTHFGFAARIGKSKEAHKHLRKINRWSGREGQDYVHERFKDYRLIAHLPWQVDLSYAHEYLNGDDMIDPIAIELSKMSINRGE